MHPTFGQLKKNRASRGQATVEYILLIVIILALLLGPLYQFSKFVSGYTDALFGEGKYFACRLETGSLVDSSSEQCGAILSAAIKTAAQDNPIDGNNPNGGPNSNPNSKSPGSSSGTNDSGSDSSSSSSGSSGNPKAKSNSVSEVADGSSRSADSSGSGSGSSAGLGAAALNRRGRPDSETVSKAKTSGTSKDSGIQKDSEYYDFQKPTAKEGIQINKDKLNRNFTLQDDENKLAEKLSAKTVATSTASNLKPREAILDTQRAPAAKSDKSDGEGFSFSFFIKWILIACIIIALVVFVGGQLFQISKSGDS